MEWLALIWPIIAIIVLKLVKETEWWEIITVFLGAVLIIPLMKQADEYSQTTDYERLGYYVVEARYYEDWNEYVHRTCTRTVGSGKNQRTEVYDCSYVAYHPEYWEITDNKGNERSISESTYNILVSKFKNKTFIDMHRWHYTNDGDMYKTKWPGDFKTVTPWFTTHRYENRVQNGTTFSYPDVDPSGLYEWPELKKPMDDPAILGSYKELAIADYYLQQVNGLIGSNKQVRIWILLFNNQPRSKGFDQESYWKGGNKNEFVVCIGLKDNKVQWCHNFCWSPDGSTANDELKVDIRNHIEKQQELRLLDSVKYIAHQVQEKFSRKHFKEFDYVSVNQSSWSLIWTHILIVIVSAGIAVANEFIKNPEWFDNARNNRYNFNTGRFR